MGFREGPLTPENKHMHHLAQETWQHPTVRIKIQPLGSSH